MKETLRDKILKDIKDMSERINQLKNHCIKYAENNNFADALKCQIKFETLEMVKDRLVRSVGK